MSSRQKSSLEQEHAKKNHKPTSNQTRNFGPRTTSDPLPQAFPSLNTPVKPATQTRTKPHTFPYTGGGGALGSESRKSEKENDSYHQLKSSQSPEKGVASTTPKMSQIKTFPSTPAMRLPLADLVGNAEEALRRHDEPKEQSPAEQVGWIANSSHPDLTPRQKRRRAQSSSPVTSSQEPSSDQRDPFGLKNLQPQLKTPRTISDPIADLWTRYAAGRNPDDPDAKPPSLIHLIEPSSPRSGPRTPGASVGGLRRWASCGMDFPATKVKRRRTHGIFRDRSEDRDGEDANHAKPVSRVGMLVEKVQASLAQPKHLAREGPSSSSPLPDKGDLSHITDLSPASQRENRAMRSRHSSQRVGLSQRSNQSIQSSRSREVDLDEFGDDDIDLDMAEAVQITPTSKRLSDTNRDPPEFVGEQHSSDGRMSTIDEDSDEFGDVDLELSLEDMDAAVPLFHSKPSSRTMSASVSAPPSRPASANRSNYTAVPSKTEQNPDVNTTTQPRSTVHPANQQISIDLTGFSDDNDNYDDDDDDDDEFGDSDLDDDAFAQAELSATQAAHQASGAVASSSRAIQRYLVKQVIEGQYTNEKGKVMSEKILLVEDEAGQRTRTIALRQSWFDTHCTPGSYVHVVGGTFSAAGHVTIDDVNNLLIVHPDHLISATVVADSFECIRRAVLQDRVKATSSANEYNVYGNILHEIFQEALKANRWDPEWLDQLAETTLDKFLEKLFEIGHDGTGKALEHLRSKMPELRSWAGSFVKAKPGPDALADDRNGKKVRMSVTKLLDVEEHVWSPTYGLKGNIDATVQAVMEDEYGTRSLTVPFEVKTGKNTSNASHRAQTALYTLLLSDRYDIDVVYGILYYMETSAISRVPAIRNELRHMVMQRNELASYVRERLQLPPMLQNPHKCGRCYAKTQCFLYHKLAEGGTAETAGVKEKFDELVGKLQPVHQVFFKKWDDLLTKEESEMMKFRRELWTMLSKEREKLGRCFSEVVVEPGSSRMHEEMAKINRYSYTFVKKETLPGFSFTESQITVGEPIVISSEQGHFALANGYVTKVSSRRISVAVDRRLHNARRKLRGFDTQKNQSFVGIMNVSGEGHEREDPGDVPVYRLDKDEFSNGMSTVRNNLLSIMDDNVYRSSEIRALVVENKAPTFKPVPSKYQLPPGELNPDQRAAIDKVMSAQDYALVLGMPGTGKTTTIAQIIRALVARGRSVLLTSYTHTAVDNILLKLRSPAGQKQDISIMRLGTISKIHPEVQDFASLAATPRHSLEEIQNAYMTPQVVATTCLGVSHFLFQKRVFDYCIVDEASQITLPVCLGPIRMARTFVLVGDHNQLPPLVQNKDAQEGGLDVSLFKLLSDSHPEAVVELGRQYRMCEDIMLLSNTLIYGGKLQCGAPAVAKRTLALPNFPRRLSRFHRDQSRPGDVTSAHGNSSSDYTSITQCKGVDSSSCWLAEILQPSRKVVFADTDTLLPTPPRDTASGSRIINATEASLTIQLVFSLLSAGVPATEIGVITFYRSQLALLRQTAKAYAAGLDYGFASNGGIGNSSSSRDAAAAANNISAWQSVEMHTCDKFQGRDKEVVIVSCVRSNETGNIGELLKDWRRINVAVTRAKSKLVMLGSASTLKSDALLDKLLNLLDRQGWVFKFPGHAEGDHAFEVGATGWSGGVATGVDITPRKESRVGNDSLQNKSPSQKRRKALTQRKGMDNFLITEEAMPTASGKENRNSDVDIDIENLGSVNKKRGDGPSQQKNKLHNKEKQTGLQESHHHQREPQKQRQMKPFKVPHKVGKTTGSKAVEDKIRKLGKSGVVLQDIVNDALGDGVVELD
ncbi:hypothetical protein AAFC00_005467 [Neodothiora populina]|uniref:DNA replication ATP-dependent helicase/nuclease DNA2 n=1 Tax=Neodothiora populina TaxID=2781224 RepID=A0ABR3PKY9_9PEZI